MSNDLNFFYYYSLFVGFLCFVFFYNFLYTYYLEKHKWGSFTCDVQYLFWGEGCLELRDTLKGLMFITKMGRTP